MKRAAPFLIPLVAGACVLAGLRSGSTAEQVLPRPPIPAATRGPLAIRFTPDSRLAAVTEADTGTVAVVDTQSGRVTRRFETGGQGPAGLALTADGDVIVANSLSGSVARLDLATGKREALAALRGEPTEVVLSKDGRLAFISVPARDEVAVLALPDLSLRQRIAVGRRPRAMALTPDGRTLLVANFQGGDVSLVDTAALREERRIATTGVNLRGITLAPDGYRAYITGQIPANSRSTDDPLDMWTNTVFTINIRPGVTFNTAEGWLDFTLASSPDPQGIVALEQEKVAVTLSGSDQALLVRTPGPHLRSYDPVIEQRVAVGAHPRGIALTPDRKEVWVANQLDSTLSVLDASTLRPRRRISLGTPEKADPGLAGRYLFGNARLASGHQFSCNSCHPDGHLDGLTWEFVHVPDGLRLRNTRNLRGDLPRTAPFRWTGHDRTIEEFFQGEVTGLLQGPKQDEAALAALRRFVERLPVAPNPYREADGSLSAAARRGKVLFEGKAGCAGCHVGERYGGTGLKGYVGTTPGNLQLDVPHLTSAYDSAPYLHDGRADTLEDVFLQHNGEQKHGNAHSLSAAELKDLLHYVRQL